MMTHLHFLQKWTQHILNTNAAILWLKHNLQSFVIVVLMIHQLDQSEASLSCHPDVSACLYMIMSWLTDEIALWLVECRFRRDFKTTPLLHDHCCTSDVITTRWQRLYLRYLASFLLEQQEVETCRPSLFTSSSMSASFPRHVTHGW